MSTAENNTGWTAAITGGPPRDLIFDALKYAYPNFSGNQLTVDFTVSVSVGVSRNRVAQITGISYETPRGDVLIIEGNWVHEPGRFEINYNPHSRTGLMRPAE